MVLVAASLVLAAAGAMVGEGPAPNITVREARGVYSVSARFHVSGPPPVAHAVLTDYANIPRFLPDVTSSVVRERADGRVVVEQEAISRMMMFSKKVHLVLDITETPGAIRFRDRCGRSFVQYEGAWSLTPREGGTDIVYELTARPSFEVPEFILKRLLKRDSTRTIERLTLEIGARAALLTREAGRHPLLDRGDGLLVTQHGAERGHLRGRSPRPHAVEHRARLGSQRIQHAGRAVGAAGDLPGGGLGQQPARHGVPIGSHVAVLQ
jgi:hypothetical protein